MLRKIKRWRRKQKVDRHIAQHGHTFDFHGTPVTISPTAHVNIKYQLLTGRYELPESALIADLVQPGTNILELGGSLGIISQYTRAKIGDDATQIIVEADPDLATQCAATMSAYANTRVISAALAYGADTVSFAHGGGNAHIGKVASAINSAGRQIITVPSTNIAALSKHFDPSHKNALICDIEGGELDLVKNEGELVAKTFDIVMFEWHKTEFDAAGSSETEFFDLCDKAGLKLIRKTGNVAAFQSALRPLSDHA